MTSPSHEGICARRTTAMPTLDLPQAANLLKLHPTTLRRMAREGTVPAARIGKGWLFVELDLLEYVRSQYHPRALQGDSKEVLGCHSTSARIRRIGGSKSTTAADAYRKALGLPIEKKPRSTTTS